MDFKNLP
jgi:hypothetical protein